MTNKELAVKLYIGRLEAQATAFTGANVAAFKLPTIEESVDEVKKIKELLEKIPE